MDGRLSDFDDIVEVLMNIHTKSFRRCWFHACFKSANIFGVYQELTCRLSELGFLPNTDRVLSKAKRWKRRKMALINALLCKYLSSHTEPKLFVDNCSSKSVSKYSCHRNVFVHHGLSVPCGTGGNKKTGRYNLITS